MNEIPLSGKGMDKECMQCSVSGGDIDNECLKCCGLGEGVDDELMKSSSRVYRLKWS